jgi:type IV pilus assembly protein PilN
MIRVNLLPVKQIKAEVSRRRDLMVGGMALGLTALIILGTYLYQSYRLSTLQNKLDTTRAEVKTLDIKVKEFGELLKKVREFESKHKIIEDLNRRKAGPVRVMESLSAATPATLWLTEFKETGGKLAITGMAVDNQTVADFLKALAAFQYFKDVELVETTEGGPGSGALKKFSLKSLISYQPPAATSGKRESKDSGMVQQEKKP